MECFFVEARDIPDAWFQLLDLCYQNGRDYVVGEGSYANCQQRRELDYVTCHIKYPNTRPLLPEIPPGLGIPNPVPEGMEYIERYLPYLMTSEVKDNETYTYGERLFGNNIGVWERKDPDIIDWTCQVDEVIAKFKRGFANNQCCMTIAKPQDIVCSDPPCLRQIDCRIYHEEKKLHFVIYFRSWDLYSGFPANLAAIVHLQEYMADCIGVDLGEMIISSKGLHLYDMYWPLVKARLGEK